MHYLILMKVSKGKDNLGNEEACVSLIKPLLFAQVIKKRASSYILHEIVDPKLVLKHVIHS